MNLLEFLILDNLLKYDSIISPKNDKKIIDKIINKRLKTLMSVKYKLNKIIIILVNTIPPIKPS